MSSSKKFFILFVLISTQCPIMDSKPHEDQDEFIKGISTFAQNFYQQCVESTTANNIVISPFSTLMALALLCQATEGSSFEELRNAMHVNGTKTEIVDRFHEYFGLVQKSAGQSKLLIGNHVFVMEGYQLKADFQEIAVNKFSSGVQTVNFTNSNETSQTINRFVKEKTNEKITELVKPEMFSSLDRVFLTNTIYLKSKWVHSFSTKCGRNGSEELKLDFFINETHSVRIDFMTLKEKFCFAELDDLDATAVRLDYLNSSLSFVIVLPRSRTGLRGLESQLENYDISRVNDQMNFLNGYVTIPKFTVQSEFRLDNILKRMGVVSMFHDVNLSGLLNLTHPLHVAHILYNVTIEVNEEHTEAAAATGSLKSHRIEDVSILSNERASSTGRQYFEKTFGFWASHPFMFYVWDRESNTTLFSGRVTNFPGNSTFTTFVL